MPGELTIPGSPELADERLAANRGRQRVRHEEAPQLFAFRREIAVSAGSWPRQLNRDEHPVKSMLGAQQLKLDDLDVHETVLPIHPPLFMDGSIG